MIDSAIRGTSPLVKIRAALASSFALAFAGCQADSTVLTTGSGDSAETAAGSTSDGFPEASSSTTVDGGTSTGAATVDESTSVGNDTGAVTPIPDWCTPEVIEGPCGDLIDDFDDGTTVLHGWVQRRQVLDELVYHQFRFGQPRVGCGKTWGLACTDATCASEESHDFSLGSDPLELGTHDDVDVYDRGTIDCENSDAEESSAETNGVTILAITDTCVSGRMKVPDDEVGFLAVRCEEDD